MLTIISVFAGAIANILQRVLMKHDNSNPYSYAIVFHFFLGILNLLFGLFYGSQFTFPTEHTTLIILSTVFWGTCTVFLFKALQILEASEVTIVSTVRVPLTIIAAIIFFNDAFDIQKIVGTIVILIATILVTNLKKGFKVNDGLVYVLGMAAFASMGIITDAFSVKHFDPVFYNTITNFLIVPLLLFFRPKALKEWKHFTQPTFLKRLVPLGIFSTVQAVTYLYSLTGDGNTSQIATIRQSQLIITVLLAILFLHERSNLIRKLVAAILVTFGIILLK